MTEKERVRPTNRKVENILSEFVSEQSQTSKYTKEGQNVCNIAQLQIFNKRKRNYTQKHKKNKIRGQKLAHFFQLLKISLQSCIDEYRPK